MSNAGKLEICPFDKFIWVQHHHVAFVGIIRLIHQCLLYAAKLASVYDVIHFREKKGLEFLIFPSDNRLLFKN